MTPNPQYPGAAPPGRKRTSGLATAALILGILGVCFFPLGLVSIVLGIVALSQIKKEPGLGGKEFAIFGIAAPLATLPIIGILAAIAIPNFIRFQVRSRQAECKANLSALYRSERELYAQNDRYSPYVDEVSFAPGPGHHYTYFLSAEGPLRNRIAEAASPNPKATGVMADMLRDNLRERSYAELARKFPGPIPVGVEGDCPQCTFTAVCVANIDGDATLDVWSISTEPRTDPTGEQIPAGKPYNHLNDANR